MNILTVLDKAKALELADFLDDLSVNGPSCNEDEGICNNVYIVFHRMFQWRGAELMAHWFREAFKLWPKFSGLIMHPVPYGNRNPRLAYRSCRLWSKRTQYGKDRRELCTFLANLIRSQCDEKSN